MMQVIRVEDNLMANSIKKSPCGWRIEAAGISLTISGATGDPIALNIGDFKMSNSPGRVELVDDLTRKIINSNDIESLEFSEAENYLSIVKKYYDSDIVLTETYSIEEDHILWSTKLVLLKGEPRSVAVRYVQSLPNDKWIWKGWSGNGHMPDLIYKHANLTLDYGDVHGTSIPAFQLYCEEKNKGVVMCMPFEQDISAIRFTSDYVRAEFGCEFYWMRLDEETSPEVSLMLRGSGGCYRPVLGWLFDKYPEYFQPPLGDVSNLEGGHVSGEYYHTEVEVAKMARLGMKWHEVHHHFPYYGQYHPEGIDEWWQVHHLERQHEDQSNFRCSPQKVHDAIKLLHKYNIAAFPYIQIAGDGDIEEMTRFYPESIAKDSSGDTHPAWIRCFKMNSDPALPFGRDIRRQIDGMLQRYPEMDGVFVDQYGMDGFDFAHDDGITMIDNRPVYRLLRNYQKNGRYLHERLMEKQLGFIANGANCIGISKYCDIIMAETLEWAYLQTQWLCIAKPMVFMCYDYDAESIEKMFQKCLIFGAMWTSSWKAEETSYEVYDRYMPLMNKLIGRKWVFESNAIKLPHIYNGNIFEVTGGNYVVTLVRNYIPANNGTPNPKEVIVNLPQGVLISDINIYAPDDHEGKTVEFQTDGQELRFDVPAKFKAGVVELKV